MGEKFEDFLMAVPVEEKGFVVDLDQLFSNHGCKYDIKLAKNGHVVSYYKIRDKKKITIMNYVFRKTGMKARIYANHVGQYEEILDTLPKQMKADIVKAGDCKRLMDPTQCSPTCQKGYLFMMDGVEYKKCRYNAFFLTLCKENNPYIKTLIEHQLDALSIAYLQN